MGKCRKMCFKKQSRLMFETENCGSSPKISVFIPVYNVEKYVALCLCSLFANTIIADCDVIIANRRADELRDVSDKIYTQDLMGRD